MANTDYLRWNANSLKELITNKLNEDGTYSDQIFPGSDLSVLIDVFCYMFDSLTFLENVGASEAIFTDAQYYENINRIVKMLGYNPLGFITSNVGCFLGVREGQTYPNPGMITLPKFTTYTTSLYDDNGEPVKYTLVDNYTFIINEDSVTSDFKPTFYNGSWKVYPSTFVAVGIPYESFTLNQLNLEEPDRIFVSHQHIKVYVEEDDGEVYEYEATSNIYEYKPSDRVFEYRLNEKKQYVISFGDNINGRRLKKDYGITVVYLQSNGPTGEIGPNIINVDGELEVRIEGFNEEIIKNKILKVDENPQFIKFGSDPDSTLPLITVNNDKNSTISKDIEDIESIRRNAPKWFREGARLITEQDFEQYILMVYPTIVHDIKVMNNWDYMSSFHIWLDSYGFLNPDIKHYDYLYGDSCDFNNVYLWMKSTNNNENLSIDNKRRIERDCDKLKPVTSEIVPFDPFITLFTPYVNGEYNLFEWDPNNENRFVVTRDKNTMITVERIKQRVLNTILNFFSLSNNKLGQKIDINNLYNQIMAIDGVKKIQTSYLEHGLPENKREYFDGLSFGMWTPHLIRGADFTRISGNFKLQEFQFPALQDPDNLFNIIDVVGDIYNISNVEF